MEIMDKDKRKPTNIELFFFDKKELEEMTSSDTFRDFIKEEAYKAVEYALDNNINEIEAFKIWNLGFTVILKKEEYGNVLKEILPIYESKEDYDTCSKITDLINKL